MLCIVFLLVIPKSGGWTQAPESSAQGICAVSRLCLGLCVLNITTKVEQQLSPGKGCMLNGLNDGHSKSMHMGMHVRVCSGIVLTGNDGHC